MQETISNYYSQAAKFAEERWQQMPENTKNCIIHGVITSVAITAAVSKLNPVSMLTGAAISATATLVDALATPILANYMADGEGRYTCLEQSLKQLAVYVIVGTAALATGIPVTAYLIHTIIATAVFNLYLEPENGFDANSTSPYLFASL